MKEKTLALLRMRVLKLTQKALAECMGCTQQYISKILKGKENMSLDTLSKLEDALGICLICDEHTADPAMVAEDALSYTPPKRRQTNEMCFLWGIVVVKWWKITNFVNST